jgi:hypothetical protein
MKPYKYVTIKEEIEKPKKESVKNHESNSILEEQIAKLEKKVENLEKELKESKKEDLEEMVDIDYKSMLSAIKDNNFGNKSSRQKFANLISNLSNVDSGEIAVRRFFKKLGDAATKVVNEIEKDKHEKEKKDSREKFDMLTTPATGIGITNPVTESKDILEEEEIPKEDTDEEQPGTPEPEKKEESKISESNKALVLKMFQEKGFADFENTLQGVDTSSKHKNMKENTSKSYDFNDDNETLVEFSLTKSN